MVRALLDALEFIELITERNIEKSIIFSATNIAPYRGMKRKIMIPTRNPMNPIQTSEIHITDLTSLLCFAEPE
jgi:hypothetical protein